MAPALVEAGYAVVCPDLRGYGQSTVPPDRPDHSQASKRAMARDLVALMETLGHGPFHAVGHDRGGYVVQRLALDHPGLVERVAMCEDYRARLGVDRAADDADRSAGRRITSPLLVVWGRRDDLADLYDDVLGVWQPWATDLSGHVLDTGHHMMEEAPRDLADTLIGHFALASSPSAIGTRLA